MPLSKPMFPKANAKKTATPAAPVEPTPEAVIAENPDALIDAVVTTTPAETTYVTDEYSQALPDDPHNEPAFEPVAPPPAKKARQIKVNKSAATPAADATAAKGKKGKQATPAEPKAKKSAKAKGDVKTGTVERNSSMVAPNLANAAVDVANNPFFTVTALGMRFEGKPTFEEWAKGGDAIGILRNGLDWSGYDWAIYGETHFGESYTQWIGKTGLAEQTLYNRMPALKKYTVDQRVYGVSITAHVEIAGLEPVMRAEGLRKMQSGELKNITELRDWMKLVKAGIDGALDGGKKDDADADSGDGEKEEETEDKNWTKQGSFLFAHVGDGMFEPVLDDKQKLPEALRALIKGRKLGGVVRLTIETAE